MKTLSKILIALCMLANGQVLIADEVKNQCLSEDGQVLTAQEQHTKGDPLCRFQWHLSGKAFGRGESHNEFNTNSSTNTVHLNVAKVWNKHKYKGEGTYIAIVEPNPMDIRHPDFRGNIASAYNHNYNINNPNASRSHATRVAGVAAARGYNGIGVRGVAPKAKIFVLSRGGLDVNRVDAMTRHRERTAVSNNSYGRGFFRHAPTMWYPALETGINEGFHGKGTVYVFSGGNKGHEGYNSNYDAYNNYHAVIAVCGVDYRGKYDGNSAPGANLWVCALDRDEAEKYGIVTTDRPNPGSDSISNDRYDIDAAGTSFSAPMVSGIVALMRQANKNLSWRDVKVILADSAVKTDSDDKGWGQSGMKYRSFSDRYHFNHQYGFGLVDAKAAVDLAEEWVNLPPREKDAVVEEEVNSTDKMISRRLIVKSDIDFIEHVDATIDFSINRVHDLSIELISPSGTTSTLAPPGIRVSNSLTNVKWRFGSSRHLGEPASGEWRLIAQNVREKEKGKNIAERRLTIALRSWELRIRGYQVKLEAVAAKDLSDLNVATDDSSDSPPLTLSLHGALWKETLEPSDFRLRNAPSNLSIASVTTTTEVQQIQLKLELTGGKLDDDYDFQVVATTGTVSNHLASLRSNAIIIPPKLEVAAAADLSDINQTSLPLTLSLFRAHWKEALEPNDFRLLNATPGLSIVGVERTSSTQVQLDLKETGKPSAYYSFQVEATAGTVSDHVAPLISNAIEIARIAHNKEAVIPQGTVGFNYTFTAEDILISPTTLRYVIKVVQIVNGKETEMDLETLGFTQKGPIISGTPQVLGTHRFKITARRQNDETISRTEYITLNVQRPYTVRTQIKVYPEGLLSE